MDRQMAIWRQFHERCLHTKFGYPSSSPSWFIAVTVYMTNVTKFTSVTLKMGPYAIPSRFFMRGTYTPNLVILAHILLEYCSTYRCLYKSILYLIHAPSISVEAIWTSKSSALPTMDGEFIASSNSCHTVLLIPSLDCGMIPLKIRLAKHTGFWKHICCLFQSKTTAMNLD